ncbi:hypothetical protein KIH74_32300 [Kineosporia sp. J2-2]|uniref:Membrane protein YczE n=1 Tax=Kineosporia corallincola TaxID=2835133 RepID=A0ABS5TS82_9ACTN|nr:hypothetical protein [Kineosporia corallincola]MBT0773671.1 hypothetical protein [Kineosporia corallincola]
MRASSNHLFRLIQLGIGLFLYGVATALMVRAAVGVTSWSVLTQGLERVMPLSFGTLTVLTSFVVLMLWIPLRQKPGIGTVLNVVVIGPAADLTLVLVDEPGGLLARWLLFTAGLLLLAVSTACYIGARYGTGPRDGLMVGLHERFAMPIWRARTLVEVTVVVCGALLGGDLGIGTVVATFAIGPLVQPLMPVFSRLPWSPTPDTGRTPVEQDEPQYV